MTRRPPRSTLFPTRRSSDLLDRGDRAQAVLRLEVASHLGDALGQRAEQRRAVRDGLVARHLALDRKSTRLNSSHQIISYAVFCLKKKKNKHRLNLKVT